MKITVAKTAGFCFGVGRAVKMTEELSDSGKKVCTLGPLIHNPVFTDSLKKRGVVIADSLEDVPQGYTLVIRTHGVPKELHEKALSLGCEVVDATCPFVRKIQNIADENTKNGETAVIAGNRDHPEVMGIKSYCRGKTYVIGSASELQALLVETNGFDGKPAVMVSQTTFSVSEYEKYINIIKKDYTNIKVFDTICNATSNRQAEAEALASENDAMIVVGGRNSSNTGKLYEICRLHCPTCFVETADELDKSFFVGRRNVGITAGASTPDSIIKEVRIAMSENTVENTTVNYDEMSFADALEESFKNLKTDKKVVGVVVGISPNEIQVDVGRKQTGYVPLDEYSADPDADPSKELKIGDELNLIIMKTNDAEGTIMLSKRRYDAGKFWEDIQAAFESKSVLEGKVTEILQKGVRVLYNGIKIFIPASQSSVPRSGNLEVLKGQTVSFRIIDIDQHRRKGAVGSIKSVEDERRAAAAEKFWADAFVGKKMTGTVKNLTSFAAFVDLGGVEGMIHRSELSWRRIKHPSDVVSVGDEVEVTIKSLDPEKKKISLAYKKLEDNPWEILRRDYPVGSVVDVKIVGLTSFGAFAQIFPGMDGLIHISQIADRHISQPSDVLSLDEVVKAKITDIDFDKKRISLSIRELLTENKEAEADEPAEETEDAKPVPIEEYAAAAAEAETETATEE